MTRRAGVTVAIALATSLLLEPAAANAQSSSAPTGLLMAAVNRVSQAPPAPSAAKTPDSVLNGILIGAAIGGALGLIPDHFDDCDECHDSLYASIAVGAGIGLLVDVLRNRGPIAIGVTGTRRGLVLRSSIAFPARR